MGLMARDKNRLLDAGFTHAELNRLSSDLLIHPQKFSLDSAVWQDVLARRALWKLRETKLGKTPEEIEAKANAFYDRSSASPWEFVRSHYHPIERLEDYKAALEKGAKARELAEARIRDHFEGRY